MDEIQFTINGIGDCGKKTTPVSGPKILETILLSTTQRHTGRSSSAQNSTF
jgi:hypothetical protein